MGWGQCERSLTGSLIVDDGWDLVGTDSDSDSDLDLECQNGIVSDLDLVLACVVLRPAKTGFELPKHWNPDGEADRMMLGFGTVQAQGEEVESG